MRTMKHWALAASAAAALALAGCGGGGSSTAGGGPDTTVPPMPVMVDLGNVTGDTPIYTAPASTGDTPIEIEAGMSATSGSVTFMCAEGDDDCTVTVADDGTVTSLGGMVTAMNSEAYATALTMAAQTKEDAIVAEAAQTTDGGAGGSDITTVHAIAISRGRDSTEVAITVDSPPDGAPEFMQAMDLGGGTTMHTRTFDANADGEVVQEVMIVTTDIEAPTETAFEDVYTLNANPATTGGDDNQSFTYVNSDHLALVSGEGFPSAALQNAVPFADEATVDGMFHGASGTYTCASADCTVSTNADGELSEIAGTWHFTPDPGATVAVADSDYLHYGFWLQRTTADGGLTYNEVETFAGSSVDPSGDVSAVEGTATYVGGATGVYVHHVHSDGGGDIVSSTSGHFTATANLTAVFGGAQIAAADQDMLTGTIDNFMLSGGESNDWSVALESSEASTTGGHSGTASGGVAGQDGSFTSIFHGDVEADTTTQVVPHPGSIVGEFNSVFSNGSVAGGFGARLQP